LLGADLQSVLHIKSTIKKTIVRFSQKQKMHEQDTKYRFNNRRHGLQIRASGGMKIIIIVVNIIFTLQISFCQKCELTNKQIVDCIERYINTLEGIRTDYFNGKDVALWIEKTPFINNKNFPDSIANKKINRISLLEKISDVGKTKHSFGFINVKIEKKGKYHYQIFIGSRAVVYKEKDEVAGFIKDEVVIYWIMGERYNIMFDCKNKTYHIREELSGTIENGTVPWTKIGSVR